MDAKKQGRVNNIEKLSAQAARTAAGISGQGRISGRSVGRAITADLKLLSAERCRADKAPGAAGGAGEWLLDNYYIARREAKYAAGEFLAAGALRAEGGEALISALSRELVDCAGFDITPEACGAFLSGFQTGLVLTQKELGLFPAALRAALIHALAQLYAGPKAPEDGKKAGALFSSLRLVSSLDMGPVTDRANLVEQTLLQDPAGVYPLMAEETRGDYRAEVERLSKAGGRDELTLAKDILALAMKGRGNERHVGWWLFVRPAGAEKKVRSGGVYITANVLLTLFVALLLGFAAKSAAAAFLLLLPVSELIKSVMDYIIMGHIRHVRLPRMALENGVPEEGRTLCVVSALLTSPQGGNELAGRLEKFRLLSRECGENLMFGILADLKEADSPSLETDSAIISAGAKAVEGLNKKYGGGFFLFTRSREKTADGGYAPYERKRGALIALASFLRCQSDSPLSVSAGDAGALGGVKYILTLDSDTGLLPGTAKNLIGAMLHPLNRPLVDSAKKVVVAGHGLIHPRISVELSSAASTDFARVFAGPGGIDPYGGMSGELYMDMTGCGGFAGKGIIDVDAFLSCCGDGFPPNRVLSHDALEGAYLRGGYMGDSELTDGFPSRSGGYFKRMHRWIRGDWQNLPWIFSRGKELTDIDKWKLFDSLRRSLVAPMTFFAIFFGFFIKTNGLVLAGAAALLALVSRLFISLAESAAKRSGQRGVRFHSNVVFGVSGAIMQTFIRLWLLPYEAWICLSAIFTALWRMCVSHKKLLQWQTAAQSDSGAAGIGASVAAMWAALPIGAVCVIFSGSVIGAAAGLMWLCSPAAAWALDLPAAKSAGPSEADRRFIIDRCREIWAYFDKFCSAEDNYLPPDNYQEQPPVGIAHRTSPTNIGLALCSCLAAMDMGIAGNEALIHIERMLDTVRSMKKWRGHLYNWYDTRTLRPLPPEYISTVDSGNLLAALTALKAGLTEYGRPDLAAAAGILAGEMDFAPLYDPQRKLMYIGADGKTGLPAGGWYDLMASEARLTSYAVIARGDVPAKNWRRLSRVMLQKDGYRGLASWTGTMFEYLMPELFLPLYRDSLLYESARFCLYVQRRRVLPGEPWGISESAFFSLDTALNYRYKASGCGALALKRGQDAEKVISPYSSFLALCAEPAPAVKNLKRLHRMGLTGPFGYYEALDFTPSRCRGDKGEAVKCVMAHHAGMSMIAAANYLCYGVMRRRFMADAAMAAYQCLLQERIPIGGGAARRDYRPHQEKPRRDQGELWAVRGQGADFENPDCCLLSNGLYYVMSTESGLTAGFSGDTAVYVSPESSLSAEHGVDYYFAVGCRETPLLPLPGDKRSIMWELAENSAWCTVEGDGLSSKCAVYAAAEFSGEMRFVELTAQNDISGELIISFEPMLAKFEDYVNHPAFWRLGMIAEKRDGCLLIRRLRRETQPEMWLCLACDGSMNFTADQNGACSGALSAPRVRAAVNVELKAGEWKTVRFSLCVGRDGDAAYNGAQRLLTLGPADRADMPGAFAALTGLRASGIGAAMAMLGRLWFFRGENVCPKDMLWRYSVSGEAPIIAMRPKCPEDADGVIKDFSLLRGCGAPGELIFVTDDGGEYARPVSRRIEDALEKLGLGPLLGADGGVHILPTDSWEAVKSAAAVVIGEDRPARVTDRSYRFPEAGSRRGVPEYRWGDECFEFYVNQSLPARCWSNVLSNGGFGYIAADSGIGHMWLSNAREQPVNRWLNQPAAVIGGETLELETGGERVNLFASGAGRKQLVRFGFGWTQWLTELDSGGISVTACVPGGSDVRLLFIEPTGGASGKLLWKTDLSLTGNSGDAAGVSVDYVNSTFTVRSSRSYIKSTEFSVRVSLPPEGFVCDGFKWAREELDNSTGYSGQPVLGCSFVLDRPLVIVCGSAGDEELEGLCQLKTAHILTQRTKESWRELLGRFSMSGGSEAMCRMMNGWLGYQTIACRMLGRASIYQSGGAIGFRDQLQDSVNILLLSPDYARSQILGACGHQYAEGDVMHWWHRHPDGDRGVRTRCSDDLLWLVWALCEYTEKTGDLSICGECICYVNSSPLAEHESSRYETPARGSEAGTVLEHALRAAEACVARGSGPHGLLKFGSGDWNDGMDRVGGESVWLTWFFAHCAERFSKLLYKLCQPDAEKYAEFARRAGHAADNCWDGSWYLRGYWPDGVPLGSHACRCCRIDSISQSFAALCPQADEKRVDEALISALDALFDRKTGVVKLFDPPFENCSRSPGYIESCGGGFRENGGQYTHGAIWLAMALLRRGKTEEGRAVLEALLPENHDLSVYLGEPFVLPADVYSAPGHQGEAGWTWYTGSAGWYFRVVTEELLGIRLENGALKLQPRLSDYTALWRSPDGGEHRITVRGGKSEIS